MHHMNGYGLSLNKTHRHKKAHNAPERMNLALE